MPFAIIAAVATVASAASSIAGGLSQSSAADQAAQQQDQNAQYEAQRAKYNVEEQQRADRFAVGEARAAYGASGVEFTGSPLDELAYQKIEDRFKEEVAKFNGLVAVQNDQAQAAQDRTLSSGYMMSGIFNAAGTLASGAGQAHQNGLI